MLENPLRINWYKLNRALHRDLGYFFFGMIIIYALSGIAMNHLDDWNPRYTVETRESIWGGPTLTTPLEEKTALEILDQFGEREGYKKHFTYDSGDMKIFIKNGSVLVNPETGLCRLEKLNRRPVFFQVTFLHYNPKNFWTWFSDLFAGALMIIGITGLFLLSGKRGLKGRGGFLAGTGIIIPLILLLLYL
jgi:uncharacterized protein